MKTSTRTAWLMSIALVLTLAGCGSSSQSDPSAHGKKKLHVAAPTDPSARSPTDMVAAVSVAKSGPPVSLKFELREPPQVGQPLDLDLVILADAPAISRIYAKFNSGEGLDLLDGGQLEQVDKPAAGAVIRHVVRVLPKQNGIFTVSATVSVDLGNDSLTRVYSIPVIVGDGLAESPAKAEVATAQAAPGTNPKTH